MASGRPAVADCAGSLQRCDDLAHVAAADGARSFFCVPLLQHSRDAQEGGGQEGGDATPPRCIGALLVGFPGRQAMQLR